MTTTMTSVVTMTAAATTTTAITPKVNVAVDDNDDDVASLVPVREGNRVRFDN